MKKPTKHILSLLMLLIFALLALGSSPGEPGTEIGTDAVAKAAPDFTLTADQLVADCKAAEKTNPVGADNTYKGKIAIISGYVATIKLDNGVAYIEIGSNDCQCLFIKSQHMEVGKLKIKRNVKVKGRIDSIKDATVILKDCSFIQ